jgi:hypothetical protein
MLTISFVVTLVSLQLPANCDGEELLRVHNSNPLNVFFWVWPKSAGKWAADKPYILRDGFKDVPLSDLGPHYFMTKDDKNRERHLGWFKLSELFENISDREIYLGSQLVTKSLETTVQVPVTEMVEQSYTVNVPVTMTRTVIRNGVPVEEKYTVNKAETNTRSVPITKYVPRMEIRTVAEEVPTLSVRRNGELQVISGDFGKRTIGISFQITQDGLEIISVKEGSPATNCRDADGNVLALKPGDVILSLNGETPTDTERVLTLIGDSRSDIRIEVRDKEGTTARRLIVTPR